MTTTIPVSVPQTLGLPADYVELTKVVPFNDLDALERTLEQYKGQVAGMIVEPCMMNAGFVLPDEGYLQGVKDLLHAHGALLDLRRGEDRSHDQLRRRHQGVSASSPICWPWPSRSAAEFPCGAIGGSDEVMGWIAEGKIDQVGTFNGNPLTMAAMHATLTEILTPEAYTEFDRLAEILQRAAATASSSAPASPATPP